MRVAFSGAHATGKTTLIEALSERLPTFAVQEEPYYLLLDEGSDFGEILSIEDFAMQLRRSIECLNENQSKVLFDRCPVDFLAYALAHSDRDAFDFEMWLPLIRASISTLDLIVFVPIESPDRIAAASEGDPLRRRVDRILRRILLDDSQELQAEVVEVEGTLEERLKAVLAHVEPGRGGGDQSRAH